MNIIKSMNIQSTAISDLAHVFRFLYVRRTGCAHEISSFMFFFLYNFIYNVGRIEDARSKGRASMWLSIVGIISATLVFIIVPIVIFVGGAAAIATGGAVIVQNG